MKKSRYVTPLGIAEFCYLTKPSTLYRDEGEYLLHLRLSPTEETKALLKSIEGDYRAFLEKENLPYEKDQGNLNYVVHHQDKTSGIETDDYLLKMKLKARVFPKDGEPYDQRPALYDAQNRTLQKGIDIWSGSKVKASFLVNPWRTISGTGITLWLKAVQVIDLVSAPRDAEGHGFQKGEGFDQIAFLDASKGFEEDQFGDDDGDDEIPF